jgi:membrane fusion protein (multidrug efflux system)
LKITQAPPAAPSATDERQGEAQALAQRQPDHTATN